VQDVAVVMGELIEAGKILGWGQSQASAEQIRAAHTVTQLTAIQSEYSMMERMFEVDVIPACAELGIGFVAFSPLASGFLSGKVSANDTYSGDDVRRVISRFEKANIRANQPLLDLLNRFAHDKGATPAQISLAWMLHKGDFIVPIPGSRQNGAHPREPRSRRRRPHRRGMCLSRDGTGQDRTARQPHRRGHRQAARPRLMPRPTGARQ
jgi:aryl-alcohol dehydrogenase-like predicted oxidoreductase